MAVTPLICMTITVLTVVGRLCVRAEGLVGFVVILLNHAREHFTSILDEFGDSDPLTRLLRRDESREDWLTSSDTGTSASAMRFTKDEFAPFSSRRRTR